MPTACAHFTIVENVPVCWDMGELEVKPGCHQIILAKCINYYKGMYVSVPKYVGRLSSVVYCDWLQHSASSTCWKAGMWQSLISISDVSTQRWAMLFVYYITHRQPASTANVRRLSNLKLHLNCLLCSDSLRTVVVAVFLLTIGTASCISLV